MKHQRTLWAVSDLHAAVRDNTAQINRIRPEQPDDWLIVAGDVAERTEVVSDVLAELRGRFAEVIWVPGNHELFSRSKDEFQGRAKYDQLVAVCRKLRIHTPEDPYPAFGDVTVVPLFCLYDFSFRPRCMTVEQARAAAEQKQAVMTDAFAIEPFVDVRAWCWDRLAYSVKRLSRVAGPTILINHWPLVPGPLSELAVPEIVLWCGTRHTTSWPERYQATKVVYGHLHLPGERQYEGVTHVEVSLGYPREWQGRQRPIPWPYPVAVWEVEDGR